MALRFFIFVVAIWILSGPVLAYIILSAPGPILLSPAVDEIIREGELYQKQQRISGLALGYLDAALKALEIEAEIGNLKELNELVGGENEWREDIEKRIGKIESNP